MTTAEAETPDNPLTKTIELHELVGPEIILVDTGMPATDRCDRCGAQAYVEAEVWDTGEPHPEYGLIALRPGDNNKRSLLFCVHHYTEHEDILKAAATRIADHRPFLHKQEAAYKGIITP